MKKVSITYHAPQGDAKMATIHGHTFFDGKAEEVEVSDEVFASFKQSPHFSCGKETDVEGHDKEADKSKTAGHQTHR